MPAATATKKPTKKPTKAAAKSPAKSSAKKTAPAKAVKGKSTSGKVTVMVSTVKGLFYLDSDAARKSWTLRGPAYFGCYINHVVKDPRNPKVYMMGARTGHLGPTILHSEDKGKTWKEATKPPAYRKAKEGEKARAIQNTFWIAPSNASEPNVWYCGAVPEGLFRSEDGGDTWKPVEGFNDNPNREKWMIGEAPGGPLTHSVTVDPNDAKHLYVCISSGGIFESKDRGKSWKPLNKGVLADFFPEKYPEYGHDPHCLQMAPTDPNRLYHQNHCGIYRLDRPSDTWTRIGDNMPKAIGDIGFPIAIHPRDADTVWVFPMDGTAVWPRVSPGGKPASYISRDGGKSWKRQDKGFPKEQGWFTVFRQAMTNDAHDPVGLYIGTTSGEVWGSNDEGATWKPLATHLPRILAVELG